MNLLKPDSGYLMGLSLSFSSSHSFSAHSLETRNQNLRSPLRPLRPPRSSQPRRPLASSNSGRIQHQQRQVRQDRERMDQKIRVLRDETGRYPDEGGIDFLNVGMLRRHCRILITTTTNVQHLLQSKVLQLGFSCDYGAIFCLTQRFVVFCVRVVPV